MLFASALYGVFLIATYVVFWALRTKRLARAAFLVLASYAFYFYGTLETAQDQHAKLPMGPLLWSAMCLGIIFVGSTLDYGIGRLLGRTENPHARRALLLVSIVYYLGVLATFKYFNFAADSVRDLLALAGVHVSPTHLRLALPFGISFFTFETMSYTIDVYRRELVPADRYLDYLLFVCFFPHLVAGPIVRPHQMLPQLAREPRVTSAMQSRGLFRIATGLAKKIVIGDMLNVGLVGRVFDNPERFSSAETLLAVYGYALYLYCDFSGYTDIAIGSAALFGYELPENFDAPYVADSLQDFWHRWHISLSTWLRDYLYIPLGGSRKGPIATYRNLMITMVLGGLWHGASWNFVIWGTLHGAALAATRMWQRARAKRRGGTGSSSPIVHALCVLATFHYVCFAWIFFRAPTFGHAMALLARFGKLSGSLVAVSPRVAVLLVVGYVLHAVPRRWYDWIRDRFALGPEWAQGIVLAAAAYGLLLASATKAEPFVYGQF